ncbi:magnesium-dependent phosphatase 1-like isoform X1 [Planococcus citri]|uniref:magnesium-dependent phosphatase 1-like isoform X1 n=1 Tax=Planococcus citri TaxID=170843 RepID=UPI0031F81662
MSYNEKLIVFDLDYTLWPLHVDECATPFSTNQQNRAVMDNFGRVCYLYSDTLKILSFLKKKNYTIAIASRAENICGSYQLLQLFGIADYFRYKEIYPGSKVQHFTVLRAKSNVDYKDIIFFDNDGRNIRDVQKLGVNCVLLTEEISFKFILSILNPKKKK